MYYYIYTIYITCLHLRFSLWPLTVQFCKKFPEHLKIPAFMYLCAVLTQHTHSVCQLLTSGILPFLLASFLLSLSTFLCCFIFMYLIFIVLLSKLSAKLYLVIAKFVPFKLTLVTDACSAFISCLLVFMLPYGSFYFFFYFSSLLKIRL